jgi:hypothetical protein
MKTSSTLLIIATLLSLQAYAGADKGGNGGGGFCYSPDKCVTLAEAGLRIPADIPLFLVSQETEDAIRKILHSLPESEGLITKRISRALGDRDTFVPIQKDSDRKFRKITEDYKKLIKTYAPNLLTDAFELFAVSDQQKQITYLLPAFFNLTPTSQALILIHEANVRGFPSSVIPYAVQWDGFLYDFYSGKKPDVLPYFAVDYNLLEAQGHNGEDQSFLFKELNTYFSTKLGRSMKISDYCDNPTLGFDGDYFCQISRDKALAGNRNIDPHFAQLLYGANIKLWGSPEVPHALVDETAKIPEFKMPFVEADRVYSSRTCANASVGDELVGSYTDFHGGTELVLVRCKSSSSGADALVPDYFMFFDKISGIRTR